ncbi:MAG: YhfC family glutamic-type intramembrane protease [Candidatus Bathyarchaeota archaeon]|nr:YhfC family glutamic-type intramembrane protease [Candidatus Bathyarchaeota archaeon]
MISFTLFLSLLVSGLLEIFIPVLLGLWIWLKLRAKWLAFLVGAVLWFVAYVVRSPINTYGSLWIYQNLKGASLLYLSIALPSLTAAVFEEGSRWLAFRFAVKDHRLENGLMYGAGHGGIESILLVGFTVLSTAIYGYFYPQTLTASQLASLSATPEWVAFIGLWERLAAITFHVAMSVLVLESFRQKQIYYLGVAMGAHFFLNFAAIYAIQWGIIPSELVVTAFAVVSLWYLWTTWKSYKAAAAETPVAQVPETPAPPTPV